MDIDATQMLFDCFIQRENTEKDTHTVFQSEEMDIPSKPEFGCSLLKIHENDGWSADSIEMLVDGNWIARNWDASVNKASDGIWKYVCDQLAKQPGVILEIAAGPGGGNFPAVLHRNLKAMIIVNDISAGVLKLWQEFLLERQLGQNVVLAAFDVRQDVVTSKSIDAISSVLGLSETHDSSSVLKECSRILKPGGKIYSMEFKYNEEEWDPVPSTVIDKWLHRIPGMFTGHKHLFEENGFIIERHSLENGKTLSPEEGDLPRDADKYDATISVEQEWIIARK